jgi:HPt (histidine-containing phosphotransfer) domain-containing protein
MSQCRSWKKKPRGVGSGFEKTLENEAAATRSGSEVSVHPPNRREPDRHMPSTHPVLDMTQLQRQTTGDEALQVEVLSLFVAEAERLMRQAEEAEDPQLRMERVHAMVGLARNVGALRLAQAARGMETHLVAHPDDLAPLRETLAETLAYLRGSVV